MAEFDSTGLEGNFPVALTEDELTLLNEVATGLRFVQLKKIAQRPSSSFVIPVNVSSVPAGAPVPSMVVSLPWPATLWSIKAGARDFAAATGLTVDVLVDRGDGGGFVSILDAATDLFAAGAGEMSAMSPEDGQQVLAYGDKIRVDFTSVGAAVVDATAHLVGQRA